MSKFASGVQKGSERTSLCAPIHTGVTAFIRKRTATPPSPLPGITRCTTLKILGVTITNGLSMAEHIHGVISSCSQTLHALRVLRAHGMPMHFCSSRSFPSGGHCQTMLCIQCLVEFLHGWEQSPSNSLHSSQHTPRLLHYGRCRHHELYRYSRWQPVPPNSYQPKSRLSAFTPRKS